MDKIEKFIRRATTKERAAIAQAISRIGQNKVEGLDIKKLKGYQDIYRVRIGDIRLIYRQLAQDIAVLAISRRSDTTYRDF